MARPKRDMVKFNLMIEKDIMDMLDEYRRNQDNPPPRAEAIRDLLRYALEQKSSTSK